MTLPPGMYDHLTYRPRQFLIEMDRKLIADGGLKVFVQLAWHTIEPEGNFRGNWHIDAICDELEALARGETRRLAIAIPPRCMKTLITGVFFVAWMWIDKPETRFMAFSYSQGLALEASLKCRRVIQSQWYQALYGDRFKLQGDANVKSKFDNDKTGYRMSSSVDGEATGFGADIIIVDDPLNAKSANSEADRLNMLRWWRETLPSRFNDQKTGRFIVVQQRLHAEDLIGEILANQRPRWMIMCLPMRYEPNHPQVWERDPRTEPGQLLWPEHLPEQEVCNLEADLRAYGTSGQLQQRPAPREGGMFKRHWFEITPSLPADMTNYSRAWDLASSIKSQMRPDPDWTATCKIGFSPSRKKYIIVHVNRWREGPGEVRKLIRSHAQDDGYTCKQTVPKDPGQAGKDQAASILAEQLAGYDAMVEAPTGDKGTRASSLAGQAEVGNVQILAGDWNEDFLAELASFPTGGHDDQLDAAASAFNRIADGTTGIMDWYRERLTEEAARRLAEAEAVVDKTLNSFEPLQRPAPSADPILAALNAFR